MFLGNRAYLNSSISMACTKRYLSSRFTQLQRKNRGFINVTINHNAHHHCRPDHIFVT